MQPDKGQSATAPRRMHDFFRAAALSLSMYVLCSCPGAQADSSSAVRKKIVPPPESVFTSRLFGRLPSEGQFVLASGDMDGDGKDDILARRLHSGVIFALLSAEHGSEFKPFTVIPPTNEIELHTLKANGDTRDDLLVYDSAARTFYLGLSDIEGNISYTLLESELTKLAYPLLVHDMNGDGLDDLLLLEEKTGSWQIVLFQTDGSAKTVRIEDMPIYRPSQVLLGDIDGDSLEDILVFQRDEGYVYVFHQKEGMSFTFSFWAKFADLFKPSRLFFGNFSTSGENTLLAWSDTEGSLWQVRREAQGARYRLLVQFALQRPWENAYQGDFNSDGRQDLLLSAKRSRYLELISAATAATTEQLSIGLVRNETPLFGDFSGSAATDFVVVRNNTEVWLNEGQQTKLRGGEANMLATNPQETPGPAICVGFPLPTTGAWGRNSWVCPPGYALYDMDDASGGDFDVRRAAVRGTCCQLPADDILTDIHESSELQCSPGFVATSSNIGSVEDKTFRCTKVNDARYQLSAPRGGIYWGTGFSRPKSTAKITKNHIPPAIRAAIGRESLNKWDSDGCIGQPFGALLVGKQGAGCGKLYFTELQFKGIPGDPPAGTPVQMFPDCAAVSSFYSPPALCLK